MSQILHPIMSRLAMENYVVVGVTLAVITVSCQLLFLPFLFSEIDAIRDEFDSEMREALGVFQDSYEKLAVIRPSSIRRQREAAKNMVIDTMSVGPADHPPHADAARTLHARTPLSGSTANVPASVPVPQVPTLQQKSKFSDELRKLAREVPSPEYDMGSEYDDSEPLTSSASDASDAEAETVGLSDTPPPPIAPPSLRMPLHSGGTSGASSPGASPPMCPMEENRCPPGLPGPPGARGAPGENGVDGNDGAQGLDAMDELTPSFPGYCISCPAGPDGKPGQPGSLGKPGLIGAPGIPGPNGKNGQPGAPGGYGSPGKQGQMGARGHPGGQGQDGVVLLNTKGPKGPPGKPGPDGQPGEDGTNNNLPGPVGMPGLTGEPGIQGAPGMYGKRGETGEAGMKGVDATCECEELVKKAIEVAENSAYVAVEAQSLPQNAATLPAGPTIPPRPEIRRTPQKASALAASGLPTLEELRNDYQKKQLVTSFAQEDGEVKKFAVAPSEVAVSEDNSEFAVSEVNELAPEVSRNSEVARDAEIQPGTFGAKSRISEVSRHTSMKEEFLESPESQEPLGLLEPLVEPSEPQELLEPEESEFIDEPEPTRVTRPALFAPPRAQLPSIPKLPHVTGDSHRKTSLDGESVKKTRSEGSTKRRRVVKVKRVQRHPAFRVFSTSEDFVNMDEGEKAFKVEKEIARESEKKVVSKEIRRAPKKLRRKQKQGKLEKKLRRVHLTPSKHLAYQHRQNSNILENIASSLGLIEKSPKPMNRVPIP